MKKIETDILSLDKELGIKRLELIKKLEKKRLDADNSYKTGMEDIKLRLKKEKDQKEDSLNKNLKIKDEQKAKEFEEFKNHFYKSFDPKQIACKIGSIINETICKRG